MIEYQGNKFRIWLDKQFEKDKDKPMKDRFTMKKAIEMMGVSKTNMYQYFKSKNLERETVNKILSVFDVKASEIWDTPSDILYTAYENNIPNSWVENVPNLYIVPFKSYAGFLRGYGDGLGTIDNIEKIYYPLIKGEGFAFQVGGQSAFPSFPENTWFVGKPVSCVEDLVKGRSDQ